MKNMDFFLTIKLKKSQVFFGPGPAKLLSYIKSTNSLRKSAQNMEMSYSKALKIINTLEDELGFLVTTRVAGGSGGGGTELTKEGEDFLQSYYGFVKSVKSYSQENFKRFF